MRGKFIVVEGLDGSGKGTQTALLCAYLKSQGRNVYPTAEPTESVTGGMIRDVLSGARQRTSSELAALFLADRVAHNMNPVNGIEKRSKRESMSCATDITIRPSPIRRWGRTGSGSSI